MSSDALPQPVYVAMLNDDEVVVELALFLDGLAYVRQDGDWIELDPTDPDDDPFTNLTPITVTEQFVDWLDSAGEQPTDLDDVLAFAV